MHTSPSPTTTPNPILFVYVILRHNPAYPNGGVDDGTNQGGPRIGGEAG